jgi:5-methylcytosine-specific restriction endonuclease McrA
MLRRELPLRVVLRVDNRVELVRLSWSFPRMFTGRYALQAGRKLYATRWKKAVIDTWSAQQSESPVLVLADGRRSRWFFHEHFYWEDEGLEEDDVKALVLQRERRQQQKLHTARSLMRAEEAGTPTRVPIPTDVRRAVFERDGGHCVECGSAFDLQYDHVLPVALGGATTVENLQLLCADCNRQKSDSL